LLFIGQKNQVTFFMLKKNSPEMDFSSPPLGMIFSRPRFFFIRIFSACFFLFLLFSILNGQVTTGYVLVKTGSTSQVPSSGPLSYQWVATNNTSSPGNFFILDVLPANYQIQSIVGLANVSLNPPLPATGPGSVTIGPFPIAANAAVTFQVNAMVRGPFQPAAGETFSLLSDSQLTGKGSQGLAADSFVPRPGTPVPTSTPAGLIQSALAAPNISNGDQPVHFLLDLNSPAHVELSLFTVTGEEVFTAQADEGLGASSLFWNLQNNTHQQVASGLYIYVLKVFGSGSEETRSGKILIIH
jgi:hypothetical protein